MFSNRSIVLLILQEIQLMQNVKYNLCQSTSKDSIVRSSLTKENLIFRVRELNYVTNIKL